MLNKGWYLANRGVRLIVDGEIPSYTEAAIDVETDQQGNPYSVAICADLQKVYVYFSFTPELIQYLKSLKIVGHNIKADIGWLTRFDVKMSQVSYDTMLAAYTIQATRLRFGLKELAEEDLGLRWPKMFQKNGNITEEMIELACKLDPSLMVKQVRHYKTKASVTLEKLPKKMDITQVPRELVANYNGMDAYATWYLKIFQTSKATPLSKKFLEKIELPTARVLHEAECRGIKIDTDKMLEFHKKYLKRMYRAKKLFLGFFWSDINLNSPVQVLKALKEINPNIQATNEDYLIPFKHHREVKTLFAYRGYAKICGTYTKPLWKMAMQSPDRRIHCHFMQHTDTGRLACRGPNLQNQPPEVRAAFIAEDGYLYVNADYSQIELRVPAHQSGDPLMVENFVQAKEKFHTMTARKINKSYQVGKTVNFLLTNSGGVGRLAEVAGIPESEAQEAYSNHRKEFKVFWDWNDREKALAVQNGGIYTLFGRWVPIPNLRSGHIGVREAAKRQAMSVKVQGSAADLMKVAMCNLARKHGLYPVVSVHDELMYEVPVDKADAVKAVVKCEMENVMKLKVPLLAEVGIGKNWAEAKAK